VLLAELAVFLRFICPQLPILLLRIGLITYTLPLIFLVLLAGLVIRFSTRAQSGRVHRGGWVACALIAFLAGGFSETYLTLQISIALLGLIIVLFLVKGYSRRKWLLMVSAILIGSLFSLAVVLASPGNAIRQAAMPPPPDILSWIKMIVLHAFLFMYRVLDANPFQFFLAVLIPLLAVWLCKQANEPFAAFPFVFVTLECPGVGICSGGVVMAPAAYVQSSYPDDRVWWRAGFVMAVMLILLAL
jgi:hypothetical protein